MYEETATGRYICLKELPNHEQTERSRTLICRISKRKYSADEALATTLGTLFNEKDSIPSVTRDLLNCLNQKIQLFCIGGCVKTFVLWGSNGSRRQGDIAVSMQKPGANFK